MESVPLFDNRPLAELWAERRLQQPMPALGGLSVTQARHHNAFYRELRKQIENIFKSFSPYAAIVVDAKASFVFEENKEKDCVDLYFKKKEGEVTRHRS